MEINPDAVVHTYKMFYMPDTADQFDFSQYDYVVDAIDTVTGKIELVMQAQRAIRRSSAAWERATRWMRPRLRWRIFIRRPAVRWRASCGGAQKRRVRHLKVVYSKEPAMTPVDEMAISCKTNCIARLEQRGNVLRGDRSPEAMRSCLRLLG